MDSQFLIVLTSAMVVGVVAGTVGLLIRLGTAVFRATDSTLEVVGTGFTFLGVLISSAAMVGFLFDFVPYIAGKIAK